MMRELSELVMKRRIKDERIGLISITGVDLAPDFSVATVYLSPFGTEEENQETWRGMTAAIKFFQSTMSRNLRLRMTPRLRYEIDNRIKEGDRILDKLDQWNREVPEATDTNPTT